MKNKNGFTLIEVLIALAIISIALTAIIKATAQNVKDTGYLENKITAYWVANDIMNQARLNLITLPFAPESLAQETSMLGQKWLWQANLQPTRNKHIQEIHVNVTNSSQKSLANLIGYRYVDAL